MITELWIRCTDAERCCGNTNTNAVKQNQVSLQVVSKRRYSRRYDKTNAVKQNQVSSRERYIPQYSAMVGARHCRASTGGIGDRSAHTFRDHAQVSRACVRRASAGSISAHLLRPRSGTAFYKRFGNRRRTAVVVGARSCLYPCPSNTR